MPRVLVAGCGYVGSKLAAELTASGHEVFALKRGPSSIDNAENIAADLTVRSSLNLPEVDVAFFTAAPSAGVARDEKTYRSIYVDGSRNLRDALRPATRLIFTSSTAVYGQDDGSEVDESSDTTPESFRGRVVLEAERSADVVIRLGGVYGPGRVRALERLRRGDARFAPGRYLNLIHRDDAAGALVHLMTLELPEKVYVGVDEEPVDSEAFYQWLAEQTGEPLGRADTTLTGKNKRCSSARLIASGYRFRYPTFREGYRELITSRSLAACPGSPNCVSSRAADAPQRMPPLGFAGSPLEARDAIVVAIEALGGRIAELEPSYVRAEFASRLFGFVDDVEWVIDPGEERVDYRSASRVGYWDLGVNRRRLRKIIRRLSRDGKISPVGEGE